MSARNPLATSSEVYAARFDQCLARLRPFTRGNTILREIHEELVRLRRDMAGLAGELPEPQACSSSSLANLAAGNARRHNDKQRNGMRRCTRHNEGAGEWLPVACFDIKNKQTGALRSWCRDCVLGYQRDRYVSVGSKVVSVEIMDGDYCVGHKCPACHKPFEVGQTVVGTDLKHQWCIDGAL